MSHKINYRVTPCEKKGSISAREQQEFWSCSEVDFIYLVVVLSFLELLNLLDLVSSFVKQEIVWMSRIYIKWLL